MKPFSKSMLNTQQLLFDQTEILSKGKGDFSIEDHFYTKGYALLDEIASIEQAMTLVESFISSIDTNRAIHLKGMKERMQLAKIDLIPVCDEIIQTGFQALHYDMGQPFLAQQQQTMYTIGMLYRPLGQRNPAAKTRIVSIEQLLSQISFGSFEEVLNRLLTYVEQYGDGWVTPTVVNTHRLACFARVLDALSGKHLLACEIDTMIGQCFSYDHSLSGEKGIEQEQEFYASLGIDLQSVEEQIEILPGQMLIFDNLRTVHGRIGKRSAQELYNALYGIKKAKQGDIESYAEWVALTASIGRTEK